MGRLMKSIIAALLFCTSFLICTANVCAADVLISVEEQKKRDAEKEKILRAEIDSENVAIAEKTQLVSITEAMRDIDGATALKSDIAQHQLNITLLKKELEAKGGTPKTKNSATAKQPVKAISHNEETSSPDWWNPYSRTPSIKIY